MFFTDKMPENCMSCPCADGEYGVCNIDYSVGLSADDRPKECPLREVKHAHWNNVTNFETMYLAECSNCKDTVWVYRNIKNNWNYCPNCGAKMEEEVKDINEV